MPLFIVVVTLGFTKLGSRVMWCAQKDNLIGRHLYFDCYLKVAPKQHNSRVTLLIIYHVYNQISRTINNQLHHTTTEDIKWLRLLNIIDLHPAKTHPPLYRHRRKAVVSWLMIFTIILLETDTMTCVKCLWDMLYWWRRQRVTWMSSYKFRRQSYGRKIRYLTRL